MAESQYRVNGIDSRVERIEVAIYGNGVPGLKVKVALMEDAVNKLTGNLRWFVRLAIATMITSIAGMVTAMILFALRIK